MVNMHIICTTIAQPPLIRSMDYNIFYRLFFCNHIILFSVTSKSSSFYLPHFRIAFIPL